MLIAFRLLQEAQDIFGVDFDFDEFKDYAGEESEEEEDEVKGLLCARDIHFCFFYIKYVT